MGREVPEAGNANYSGSWEQFVEYPGNVYLIPAGPFRGPAGIYICGEYHESVVRWYFENYPWITTRRARTQRAFFSRKGSNLCIFLFLFLSSGYTSA